MEFSTVLGNLNLISALLKDKFGSTKRLVTLVIRMRANTAQQDRKLVNDLERQLAIPSKQWAEVLEPATTTSFI